MICWQDTIQYWREKICSDAISVGGLEGRTLVSADQMPSPMLT